jgi:hypothetical protein
VRVYLSSADVVTPQCLEIMSRVKNDTIPNIELEFSRIVGEELPPNATVFARVATSGAGMSGWSPRRPWPSA